MTVQLEEYANVEQTEQRVYLVIDIEKKGAAERSKGSRNIIATKQAAGDRVPIVVHVDGKPKASASVYDRKTRRRGVTEAHEVAAFAIVPGGILRLRGPGADAIWAGASSGETLLLRELPFTNGRQLGSRRSGNVRSAAQSAAAGASPSPMSGSPPRSRQQASGR